jgi:hypothetical protein
MLNELNWLRIVSNGIPFVMTVTNVQVMTGICPSAGYPQTA